MNFIGSGQERSSAGQKKKISALDGKFYTALVLYAVLAALAWFTLGEGRVLLFGRLVEPRWLPLIVIGGLALRTVLAYQAEKIRRGGASSKSGAEK